MTRKQFETLIFAAIAVAFLFCILAVILGAQQAPAPASKYPLSEAQQNRMTIHYQKIQMDQLQIRADYQDLLAEAGKIARENKLGDTVQWDVNAQQFVDAPAAAPVKDAPKPDVKP